jgi:hypothetical protein
MRLPIAAPAVNAAGHVTTATLSAGTLALIPKRTHKIVVDAGNHAPSLADIFVVVVDVATYLAKRIAPALALIPTQTPSIVVHAELFAPPERVASMACAYAITITRLLQSAMVVVLIIKQTALIAEVAGSIAPQANRAPMAVA